jgi:hypothetical protein
MMRRFALALFATLFIATVSALAQPLPVVRDRPSPGDFPLSTADSLATIVVGDGEAEVVKIAARMLADDIERVTGRRPAVAASAEGVVGPVLLAGTVNVASWIPAADAGDLRGQWETFRIKPLDDSPSGVDQALAVIGSDRRATAYGLLAIGRAAGVSPWVWWADVVPTRREALYVSSEPFIDGPPRVQYRGIFLNDEDWGLQPWAAKTFEPETGDIGPKTYARMFELLLRLRCNYLWPAMHPSTRAFNHYEDNKLVADRHAVAMGSSHAEPMLRNNVDEWTVDKNLWNFETNREGVLAYWEERIRANGRFENVYTIGMRGIHDSGMPGGGSLTDKARRLERIFTAQREMLSRTVGKPADQIPQIFVPYKEVLEIYRTGIDLPHDVTIVWSDDNHGYVRQFSNQAERSRSGRSGVYYHLSYWGRPHDFLWLYTMPPALVWEEMTKALEYGADRVWIGNVGDLKPCEIGMQWFLRIGWEGESLGPDQLDRYLVDFFTETFGPAHAPAIAGLMKEFYTLNYQRKPEHMGWSTIYPNRPVENGELSPWHNGDEIQRRLDAFDRLQTAAEAIGNDIPPDLQDAYFQLVLYPVRGAADMNGKHLHAQKSRLYAAQGRPSANLHAERARAAHARIQEATAYYNQTLARGKWNHMMSPNPRKLPVFDMPPVETVEVAGPPQLAVCVEGQSEPAQPGEPAETNRLPRFDRYLRREAFIDLIDTGADSLDWRATVDQPWIRLSATSGTLSIEQRLHATIDYDAVPRGDSLGGAITIAAADRSFTLPVEVFNPDVEPTPGTFVQIAGQIAIDAEHFAQHRAASTRWRTIDGLGRTGAAVGLFPRLSPSLSTPEAIAASAPVLDYPIHVFDGGKAKLTVEAIPTHEATEAHALICAVSIDDAPPMVVRFTQGNDERNGTWQRNVLRASMFGSADVTVPAGGHTLKLWGADPSVVVDRIELDFGNQRPTYLGPPETRVRNTANAD